MAWKVVHPTLGIITAWADSQWKMLVEAKDVLHQLGMLEWAYQRADGMKCDDLASLQEAEMSPESI
jgi:hypothetical protein